MVLVFHGLTMRVFLTRWFKWSTEQFEGLNNPLNCEARVMQLGPGGEYSLAGVHSREEMESWGLTPVMIQGEKGEQGTRNWSSFLANLEGGGGWG